MMVASILALPATAQKVESNTSVSGVAVPFVGCRADGQTGPLEAPKGRSKVVLARREEAELLAYYNSPGVLGVLAPRGWHCFEFYGSSGSSLQVSPFPIDFQRKFSSAENGHSGPIIEAQWHCGDTSGRWSVAEVIALVFPSRLSFVRKVVEDFETPEGTFHYGPYPADQLTYRRNIVVEYVTPAGAEGLGTKSRLKANDRPIHGVAILTGETPDLLHLAVRLPEGMDGLTSGIVRQFESDAAGFRK